MMNEQLLKTHKYFYEYSNSEGSGRVRVFSVKVGLVTLCSGKLIDKLRCKSRPLFH